MNVVDPAKGSAGACQIDWPESWRSVPLWSLFERIKDVGHPEEEMLSVYRDHGVVRKGSRDDNFNKTAENREIYQLVDDGWLIVNRMKAWQGSVGVSAFRGIVSGHYICFKPHHHEDSRFLNWLLRSDVYAFECACLSRGVRPNQIEIDNDMLRVLPVHLPSLEEQRRIADFLDAKTARIDRLVTLLEQQCELLEQRRVCTIDESLGEVDDGRCPLKHLATVVDTEHKTAPNVPGGGYWIAGTSSIRRGRLIRDELYETDQSSFTEWTRRRAPRPGDLLMTREAPVGEVAEYAPGDPEIAIGQRMVLISPDPRRILGGYLLCVLMSTATRQFYADATQGSLHPHLNMDDIRRIPVPALEIERQGRISRAILSQLATIDRTIAMRRRQQSLLGERRQALITAAVTGQFDVTTARGVDVS